MLAYLPVETIVRIRQQAYYASLGQADAQGEATPFIEFMLSAREEALEDVCAKLNSNTTTITTTKPHSDVEQRILQAIHIKAAISLEDLACELGLTKDGVRYHY